MCANWLKMCASHIASFKCVHGSHTFEIQMRINKFTVSSCAVSILIPTAALRSITLFQIFGYIEPYRFELSSFYAVVYTTFFMRRAIEPPVAFSEDLNSVCAIVHSDQSNFWSEETFAPWLPIYGPSKTLIRLRECAGCSET